MNNGALYTTFLSSTQLDAPYGGVVRTSPDNGGSKITIFPAGSVTNPASSLMPSNGGLLGTTTTSTTDNAGTVFKYVP